MLRRLSRAQCPGSSDEGFTLLEMIIALLVLAIVMAAVAPSLYTALHATSDSNVRSEANGVAVAATEQIRSYPYYEISYSTNSAVPSACAAYGSDYVTNTGSTAALDTMLSTEQVGPQQFQITRCAYWATSTSGLSEAYKQIVVIVRWTQGSTTRSLTQTSAVYPGGESPYTSGKQNYAPQSQTGSSPAVPPDAPTGLTAQDDTTSPSTKINLSWTAPTSGTPAASYLVQYVTAANLSYLTASSTCTTPVICVTSNNTSTGVPVGASTSGTTYYFQVWSVASDGTTQSSTPSNQASASTTAAASNDCTVTNFVISPSGSDNIDSNGHLKGNPSQFSFSVQVTGNCSDMTVGFSPGSVYTGGTPTDSTQAAVTGSGTLTGTSGTCLAWVAGTHDFTVYNNGSIVVQSNTIQQKLVSLTQVKGNAGNC